MPHFIATADRMRIIIESAADIREEGHLREETDPDHPKSGVYLQFENKQFYLPTGKPFMGKKFPHLMKKIVTSKFWGKKFFFDPRDADGFWKENADEYGIEVKTTNPVEVLRKRDADPLVDVREGIAHVGDEEARRKGLNVGTEMEMESTENMG